MTQSSVHADHFEIERQVGSGGMGEVYRAVDRRSGAPVALKLALSGDDQQRARSAVEASALASLDHPAIVRLVASGVLADGRPYLAMEWLDGEDLGTRLARGALAGSDAVLLGARVAEGLAAAHAAGIVHRDLKPSNLFLPGGEIARVKLVDFGIARMGRRRLTQTGALIGTPGYMAPEQARGEGEIGPPADLFALGAVLFECLAGQPAFSGQHAVAVLAKVLFDAVPALGAFCPGLPPGLIALVARLLAKAPGERPGALETAAALAALKPALDGTQLAPRSSHGRGDATALVHTLSLVDEQRLVCVLVARPAADDAAAPAAASAQGTTAADTAAEDEAANGVAPSEHDALERLRAVVAPLGGRAERLLDGALVASWLGDGVPRDLATRAARAALLARERLPGAALALGSGLTSSGGTLRLSAALDRAAAVLDAAGPEPRAVLIDEVTAGLLDDRFEIRSLTVGHELLAKRSLDQGKARLLLGRAAPCVGRDRELRSFGDLLDECVEAPRACAAVITAPPGIGKSRLRHELVRLARLRGDADIWSAEADELGVASPFALLGEAVQQAAGVRPGDSLEVRRRKLQERVARRVAAAERPRLTAFLGEIAAAHFPESTHPLLGLARSDPKVMAEQVRRAFLDLLQVESAAGPLLLVLEDLHWGDLPSLKLVAASLTALRDRPFMVLAFSRPEGRERCPELWAVREVQEIRLNGLNRRAAAQLVRHALPDAADAVVQRIIERADGNALYLEELLRAVAAGRGDDLPETIAAMVQARLGDLSPEERRALRAASVLGGAFWPSAVDAIVGSAPPAGAAAVLEALVEREVLERRAESHFPGEPELIFRHALLREGAYALMTESDRTAAHLRAAEWLEQQALLPGHTSTAERLADSRQLGERREIGGEVDASRIAHHFELGRSPERAVEWHARAAEHALRIGDAASAATSAARAIELLSALPPRPERASRELGLQIVLFTALSLTRGYSAPEVEPPLLRARELCAPGSPEWPRLLSGLWQLYITRGEPWTARAMAEELLAIALERRESHAILTAHMGLGMNSMFLGEYRAAREHLEIALARFDRAEHDGIHMIMGADVEVHSLCYLSTCLWFLGFPEQSARRAQRAIELAEQIGQPFIRAAASSLGSIANQLRRDRPGAVERSARAKAIAGEHGFVHYVLQSSILHGWARTERGGSADGVEEIEGALAVRRKLRARLAMTHLLGLLADAQAEIGRFADALATLREAMETMDRTGERLWAAEIYRLHGEILRRRGEPGDDDCAEDCFLRAVDIARCQGALSMELRAAVSLARLWQGQGCGAEARQLVAPVLAQFSEGFDNVDLKEARALLLEEK